MKRQLPSIVLAVAFYLPSAASQTDTLPRPDYSKYPAVSLLSTQFKSINSLYYNPDTASPLLQNVIRLKYDPDIYQMKKNLSQDLYQLRIQNRNNEWRNLFTGLLTGFVKQ